MKDPEKMSEFQKTGVQQVGVLGGDIARAVWEKFSEDPNATSSRLANIIGAYTGKKKEEDQVYSVLNEVTDGEVEWLAESLAQGDTVWMYYGGGRLWSEVRVTRDGEDFRSRVERFQRLLGEVFFAAFEAWRVGNYWSMRGEAVVLKYSWALFAAVFVFLYRNMWRGDFALSMVQCVAAVLVIVLGASALGNILPRGVASGILAVGVVVLLGVEYVGAVWLRRSARVEAASLGACVAGVPAVVLGVGLLLHAVWEIGLFGGDLSAAAMIAVSAVSYSLVAPIAKGRLAELMARPSG